MSDDEARRAARAARDDPWAALESERLLRRTEAPRCWAFWYGESQADLDGAEKVSIRLLGDGTDGEAPRRGWRVPIHTLDGFRAIVGVLRSILPSGLTPKVHLAAEDGIVLAGPAREVAFEAGWPGREPLASETRIETRPPGADAFASELAMGAMRDALEEARAMRQRAMAELDEMARRRFDEAISAQPSSLLDGLRKGIDGVRTALGLRPRRAH